MWKGGRGYMPQDRQAMLIYVKIWEMNPSLLWYNKYTIVRERTWFIQVFCKAQDFRYIVGSSDYALSHQRSVLGMGDRISVVLGCAAPGACCWKWCFPEADSLSLRPSPCPECQLGSLARWRLRCGVGSCGLRGGGGAAVPFTLACQPSPRQSISVLSAKGR